jgi:hypothetical protein
MRMHDERDPSFRLSSASPTVTARSTRPQATRWVAWMPLLFVAAFLYWSVALGLGGLSLMAASAISGDLQDGQGLEGPELAPSVMEPAPGHTSEPIVIHLEESAEPEDVNDNVGAVMPADQADSQIDVQTDGDDGTGRLPGQSRN